MEDNVIESRNYKAKIEGFMEGVKVFFRPTKFRRSIKGEENAGITKDEIEKLLKDLDNWNDLQDTLKILKGEDIPQTDFRFRDAKTQVEEIPVKAEYKTQVVVKIYLSYTIWEDPDGELIRDYLKDIEKWVLLVNTGKAIVEDVGLIK